jgi:hypothetical protein
MTEKKARRLSDLIPPKAQPGINDGRWFLMEHQLYQVVVSLQAVRQLCEVIGDNPEGDSEWELARSALEIITPVYVKALGARAAITSLLAGTEIAERLGGIEDDK